MEFIGKGIGNVVLTYAELKENGLYYSRSGTCKWYRLGSSYMKR